MCSSASGTGTAQLFLESSTQVIPWAQTGLDYTTMQLSTCTATTMGVGQQRYGEGREEGRKDTVTERVLHQHHEITCSEAEHCFLQEKTLIRLLQIPKPAHRGLPQSWQNTVCALEKNYLKLSIFGI